MTYDLKRLLELSGGKNVTIVGATEKNGNINRKKADRILDPHDYFGRNKRRNKLREYVTMVEQSGSAPECGLPFRSPRMFEATITKRMREFLE